MNEPLVIDPELSEALPTLQGQRAVTMLDGTSVRGLPFSQVAIPMEPGKVTIPHVHDHIHVFVVLSRCDPGGVLTLYGEHFEKVTWLRAGQGLYIPPGVNHMAIRPRARQVNLLAAPDHRPYLDDALAFETRGTPDPYEDVRQLPEHWLDVALKIDSMGLMDSVTWPVQAFAALRAVGV